VHCNAIISPVGESRVQRGTLLSWPGSPEALAQPSAICPSRAEAQRPFPAMAASPASARGSLGLAEEKGNPSSDNMRLQVAAGEVQSFHCMGRLSWNTIAACRDQITLSILIA
jgi:hypothetical protein